MRFGTLILGFMAIAVNIVTSIDERKIIRTDDNDWSAVLDNEDDLPIIQDEYNDHQNTRNHHEKCDVDKCPREFPLTYKSVRQTPYEFERYKIVPDLLEEAPALYLEVCLLQILPAASFPIS